VMGGKLKDENKWGNCRKLFSFIAKSYERFQSFGVHKSMSAIKKM
jgi:ubiquinone/menaquinone biosynthesis C-methylase UbiE